MDERNAELAERQDFNVAIDPEILDVIQSSTAISTQKGNSAMLLKIGSKRRRTKAEMDEFRAQQANQFEAMAAKDEQIAALQEQPCAGLWEICGGMCPEWLCLAMLVMGGMRAEQLYQVAQMTGGICAEQPDRVMRAAGGGTAFTRPR